MSETWNQYEERVRQYIIELKEWHGSQRALAKLIGVSDTTISLFINGKPLSKYPAIWQWLVETEGFDPPPPVDPRPRRWMRTDSEWLALLTFTETYPEFPLYMEQWEGTFILITPDLIREFLQREE